VLDEGRFLKMVKNPTLSIDKQIDSGKAREVMKNHKNIIPIIEAIILCGRQNLALKGHRESRKILTCSDSEINNESNFREILRYLQSSG